MKYLKHKSSKQLQSTTQNVSKRVPNPTRKERNSFAIVKKSSKPNSLCVRIPALPKRGDYCLMEAALAELYRALGPSNGVPKTRVEVDKNNTPQALLSQYNANFRTIDPDDQESVLFSLRQNEAHVAHLLAMMYITEESDLSFGNVDLKQGIRIDFEYSLFDFSRLLGKRMELSAFTGRNISGSTFLLHPVDLKLFPNLLITKPRNMLQLEKKNWRHHQQLHTWNRTPQFNQTIYQYFFKALLFDEQMIAKIIQTHVPEGELSIKLGNYIHQRLHNLKSTLIQVPEFRENVLMHFELYKKNILKELTEYNKEFEKGRNKYQAQQSDQFEFYSGRIIDIAVIEKKLNDLHKDVKNCHYLSDKNTYQAFRAAFKVEFIPTNSFHQYAMQMLIMAGLPRLNSQQLKSLIENQLNNMAYHLHSYQDLPLEGKLLEELNNKNKKLIGKSNWQQAEILFNLDQQISEVLIDQEEKWYSVNYHIEQSEKTVQDKLQTLQKTPKINTADPLSQSMLECEQTAFLQITSEGEDAYIKIQQLLKACVDYGREVKERGDAYWAIRYLEITNQLYEILNFGIDKNQSPQDVAGQMIKVINEKNTYLQDHQGIFKWLIAALLNIFYTPKLSLSGNTVLKPLIATERMKKLSQVVETVNALPTMKP